MKAVFGAVAFILVICGASAHADISANIAACRAETDSLKRLVCYDEILVDSTEDTRAVGVIETFEGQGSGRTRPFYSPGPFIVKIKSDRVAMAILRSGSRYVADVTTYGSPKPAETYFPTGGEYFLEIDALYDWKITVVSSK